MGRASATHRLLQADPLAFIQKYQIRLIDYRTALGFKKTTYGVIVNCLFESGKRSPGPRLDWVEGARLRSFSQDGLKQTIVNQAV
ncbi:hypothetical protein MHY01S_16210 [Meiothermus hypogaeus NBRC 106114]|uniref:Uncharacterized protein n=1 Tax=Meiothermus hypogaeus NBRC 106114 TaxID=1227553 RepID=A0A511R1H3_9DEIN|nr:hypothetical protein MHY01S_16210 [Meiothermus hypogaeus NBRC 106114]